MVLNLQVPEWLWCLGESFSGLRVHITGWVEIIWDFFHFNE